MAKTMSKKSAATKTKAPTRAVASAGRAAATKSGSKAQAIIGLLRREGGAKLDEMMTASSWQKHSVRGFMAGALKKRHGLTVSSEKTDGGRVYRIDAGVQE